MDENEVTLTSKIDLKQEELELRSYIQGIQEIKERINRGKIQEMKGGGAFRMATSVGQLDQMEVELFAYFEQLGQKLMHLSTCFDYEDPSCHEFLILFLEAEKELYSVIDLQNKMASPKKITELILKCSTGELSFLKTVDHAHILKVSIEEMIHQDFDCMKARVSYYDTHFSTMSINKLKNAFMDLIEENHSLKFLIHQIWDTDFYHDNKVHFDVIAKDMMDAEHRIQQRIDTLVEESISNTISIVKKSAVQVKKRIEKLHQYIDHMNQQREDLEQVQTQEIANILADAQKDLDSLKKKQRFFSSREKSLNEDVQKMKEEIEFFKGKLDQINKAIINATEYYLVSSDQKQKELFEKNFPETFKTLIEKLRIDLDNEDIDSFVDKFKNLFLKHL